MINQYKKNILLVCAHPDDEILGCGGTLSILKKNKCKIKVLILSEGITARYDKKLFKSKKVLKEIKERNINCMKANAVLGIKDIVFLNNLCCRLDQVPIIDITKKIEKVITSFKPSIIFTHNSNDVNIDHKICHNACIAACRPVNKTFIEKIYTFEVLSSTEWNTNTNFKPQTFVDISNVIDLKIKSLLKYENEILKNPNSRSIEKIKSLASYRGAFIGVKDAEAFQLIRSSDL
tara:strand:+ start:1179 stop:1880 length:702 start_codon:yes stop_codon:yes gene_type:complete